MEYFKTICDRIDRKGKKHDQFMADAYKRVDLINRHLNSCGNDLTLISLKGHLVIENLLEMNLCRLMAIDNLPKKKGRLGFSQKLNLIQVVVEQREPGPNADLFCVLDALNDLRNQLGHTLKNQEEIEKDVQLFIDEYCRRVGMKSSSNQPLPKQLRCCIVKLCQFLAEVRFHLFKLEQREGH